MSYLLVLSVSPALKTLDPAFAILQLETYVNDINRFTCFRLQKPATENIIAHGLFSQSENEK